jgi:hypothetical protein
LRTGVVNRRVPVARTGERLALLRARGWTWPKLAAATGFSIPTLEKNLRAYRAGTMARTWSLVERAVLDIEP